MASAYDEFISNFDLNHLGNSEESTKFQKLEPNPEKRRRSIYLLKGRISGTDDIIQKYLAISEDYNRALKAHSVTKEELKQACINYKDIQETCTHLETEKKALIANQDMLLKRVSEAENKCNALLSYSNQLQVLVKQLETEKEALTVEKQIDNSNGKMLLLQKEKETMLKDIISFKQVILGKKKKNSRIIKLLNLYSGQEDPDIYTSDESSNEMTNNENSSNSKRKGHKEISNIDDSFIDNDSDSSGEHERSNKCSGPCVTNLNTNSQCSPGIFESPPKLIDKIKGIDAANSSLKEKEAARSIFDPEHIQDNESESCAKRLVDSCTSPVFKSVFVDVGTDPIENVKNIEHKEETKTCSHIPLSIEEIKEKKQAPMLFEEWISKCLCLKSDFMIKNKAIHVDSCTSPISELLRVTDGDIDECANNVNIEIQNKGRIVKSFQESVYNDKHTAEIETQTIKAKLVEVGTSPITDLLLRTRINLIDQDEIHKPNDIIQESNNNKYPQKLTAEIETQTGENTSIEVKVKKIVDASTNTDKLIINRLQNAVQMSNKYQKVTAEIETQTEDTDFIILKKFVDSCTSPVVRIRFENINFVYGQDKLNDDNVNEEQIPISNEQDNLIQTHSSQQLLTQEKICLENNSSNNSHRDSIEIDAEVQNILSVMKFNRDLLSPLPTTPCNVPRHSSEFRCSEQQYNALMGGINKILNIVRTSHSNLLENDERINLDTNLEESLFGKQYDLADGHFSEEVEEENINVSISSNNNSVYEKRVDVVMTGECTDTTEISNNKKMRSEKSVEAYTNNSVNGIDNIERIATTIITVADEETVNDHQSTSKQPIGLDYLNNITEKVQNSLEVNKLIRGESELCASNYKKNSPNLKKKSKLEKLRNKLIPTNKIKKTAPSVPKRVPKICRSNTADINLATLKQKIAYENAVKVMAELKSNQKVETKSNATDLLTGVLGNRVDNINNIETPLNDKLCKIMTTRSQKARLNRKEKNTVSLTKGIALEDDIKSIEKSPVTRKGRKRSADVKLDHLQGSCKRALRSSNDNKIDVSMLDVHKSTASSNKLEKQKKQPSVTKKNEHLSAQDSDEEIVSDINMEQNNTRNTSVTENSNAFVISSNEIKSDEKNLANDSSIMKDVGNQESVEVPESDTTVQQSAETESNPMSSSNNGSPKENEKDCNIHLQNPIAELMPLKNDVSNFKRNIVSYSDDLDLYAEEATVEDTVRKIPSNETVYLKDNILCVALDRYGVNKIKFAAKKIPESITNKVSQTLEESISEIISSPSDQQKNKMNRLINHIKTFKIKQILSGLIKYLKDPTRKCELFNKIQTGPAPSMTKAEAILLYVIEQLNVSLSEVHFLHLIYKSIEHSLFQLNQSPTFDVIESMSHFYAIMCRYFRNKSRLRCFMLDAMYCLQFKAVSIIKQCLDVCPGVLPYANEHMAKTSLVTCLVYLLHFYKCNDQYNRTQEIRNILSRKYHYQFSEWSETMILEIFRKAIMNLKGIQNDKKMLRIALIILCKRHGTKWCQTKIIQNMLLPLIQNPDIHEKIKQFCVSMLGPLLKPFPANNKAQCESAINQLLHLLKQNPSHEMKEAIYSSLIFVNKHDQERVVQALLSWNPKSVSQDFEEILNDYVMEKPLRAWRRLVTQPSQCT